MDKFRFGIRFLRFLFCGVLLITLAGCFGAVGTGYDGPGYYGPGYFDDYGPDVTIFGGYGGRAHWGHDRDFSRRGAESRGAVGHGGHFGGGGHVGGGFTGGGGHGGGGGHR